jgi:hypothetical protein
MYRNMCPKCQCSGFFYGKCSLCKYDMLTELYAKLSECCYSEGLQIMEKIDEVLIARGVKDY